MTVRMALRDASWYNRPNTRSIKVYHVVVEDYVPACNTTRVLLDEHSETSVAGAHYGLRCRRRACRKLWEAES